jgi:hypothetical protein
MCGTCGADNMASSCGLVVREGVKFCGDVCIYARLEVGKGRMSRYICDERGGYHATLSGEFQFPIVLLYRPVNVAEVVVPNI